MTSLQQITTLCRVLKKHFPHLTVEETLHLTGDLLRALEEQPKEVPK